MRLTDISNFNGTRYIAGFYMFFFVNVVLHFSAEKVRIVLIMHMCQCTCIVLVSVYMYNYMYYKNT